MPKTKTATPAIKEPKVKTVKTEKPAGKRGRPVVGESARQIKLAERAARVAAGGSIERGRPANPTSKRQARMSAQAARAAAGIAITVGRPKGTSKKEAVAA
jgi:hypothetical protein